MDGSVHPVPDGYRLGADLCGVPGGAVALRASHENNCERISRGFFRSFSLSCGGHSPTQNPKDGIVLRERIQYNRIYCTKQKGEVSAMVATVLIAAALAGYSIFVVVRKVQRRKNGCGGCCGCGEGTCQKSKKL